MASSNLYSARMNFNYRRRQSICSSNSFIKVLISSKQKIRLFMRGTYYEHTSHNLWSITLNIYADSLGLTSNIKSGLCNLFIIQKEHDKKALNHQKENSRHCFSDFLLRVSHTIMNFIWKIKVRKLTISESRLICVSLDWIKQFPVWKRKEN